MSVNANVFMTIAACTAEMSVINVKITNADNFFPGVGFGLMYLPSIVIVSFYFVRKRALATGIAVCGSGIGTFIFTSFAPYLIRNYGWKGSYWIISGIILHGILCAMVFRPLEAEKPKPPRPAISSDDIPVSID